MADVVVDIPDSDLDKGKDTPTETKEPWKDLGFDSSEAMVKAFAKMKDDIKILKPDARSAKEFEKELTALRKEKSDREAAEMSDLEKAQIDIKTAKNENLALIEKLAQKEKDITYEREISKRLAACKETDRGLVRSLYDASCRTFADEAELGESLDEVDKQWKAHMEGFGGGPQIDVGGGTRNRVPQDLGPASKDEVLLAHDIAEGGVQRMLERKFGIK